MVLIAAIVSTAIAGAIVAGQYSDDATRWTALGAVFAAGAVVLAFIAGIIATLAYKSAVLRPQIRVLMWDGPGPRASGAIELAAETAKRHQFPGSRMERLVLLKRVEVTLRIENDGPQTARNISIRLTPVGIGWWASPADLPVQWGSTGSTRIWG